MSENSIDIMGQRINVSVNDSSMTVVQSSDILCMEQKTGTKGGDAERTLVCVSGTKGETDIMAPDIMAQRKMA